MTSRYAMICALLIPLSFACSSADEINEPKKNNQPQLVGAPGVVIEQVAIYQGVKRMLMVGGAPIASDVPLVNGRDAVLRLFYTAPPEQLSQQVTGKLIIEGYAEELQATGVLGAISNDADMGSTVNFIIPGAAIGDTFSYSVALLQAGTEDNPTAHYPQQGTDSHVVEGPRNTFRLIVAPFSYQADGSGRLPDLSPERVEELRLRLLQLYPVSNVEVTVREPQPWHQPLQSNGTGWQELGLTLYGYRGQDGVGDEVYYYGTFNPAESLYSYCGSGCLLGVTLLNNSPPDTGNVGLRLALGVGFDSVFKDTAAHELGHAHGREHAPCGPGLDPSSIDKGYPHAGGKIGVWGWDIVGQQLVDPAIATDIMSYCKDQWISDHNYRAMLNRGKNVNLPKLYQPGLAHHDHELVAIDGQGRASWHSAAVRAPSGSGEQTTVTVFSGAGAHPSQVRGHFFRFDHLPGGWLMFPQTPQPATRIEVTVNRRFVVAKR